MVLLYKPLVIILLLCVGYSYCQSKNDFIVGVRQHGDILIHSEEIDEKFLLSGKKLIINKTIMAPENYVITQVKCVDRATDGTGAEVDIMNGSPDSSIITLRFKSQRFHGIFYHIEAYAKPRY